MSLQDRKLEAGRASTQNVSWEEERWRCLCLGVGEQG